MAIKDGLDAIWEEEEKPEDPLYEHADEHEDDDENHSESSLAWNLDEFPDPSQSVSLPTRSFSPSSEHSSFTASPEWRESGSSHLKYILSALIEDVETLSEGLDEIQADIHSLRLSKHLRSPAETAGYDDPPKLVFTPATPDLDGDGPELEDWEIEIRLKGMLADVQMMYADLAEMSEEGYFPDDLPASLAPEEQASDTSSSEDSDKTPLEPEDVMQMLTDLRIPEMLEMESSDDESLLHDAHSVSVYSSETQRQAPKEEAETMSIPTEDLFADEEEPQSSTSWSSRFGSAPSLSLPITPSDSEKEGYTPKGRTSSYANESLPELSVVDERFLRNFEAAVSPLSQFIRSHSPTPKSTVVRSIKHSSTVLFSAAPKPASSTLRSRKFGSSPSTPTTPHLGPLFSDPKPLLPFSIRLTPRSPDVREDSQKRSIWSRLKLMKRNSTVGSIGGSHRTGSPLKLFNSPSNKRSTVHSSSQSPSLGMVYEMNSIRGNPGCLPSRPY
ncbi:hypothetical protein BJ322DRAFT_1033904 [Thelephora terrestris]|uniref:Uncharacterized protein n=1 Tax=Thelephora terrestris TaxID=56493 RepID=A0A9P6HRS8_9AGAM|nr:hypothetical protein BJ322DRAFT_1033904 [Thelephora terrestris]